MHGHARVSNKQLNHDAYRYAILRTITDQPGISIDALIGAVEAAVMPEIRERQHNPGWVFSHRVFIDQLDQLLGAHRIHRSDTGWHAGQPRKDPA